MPQLTLRFRLFSLLLALTIILSISPIMTQAREQLTSTDSPAELASMVSDRSVDTAQPASIHHLTSTAPVLCSSSESQVVVQKIFLPLIQRSGPSTASANEPTVKAPFTDRAVHSNVSFAPLDFAALARQLYTGVQPRQVGATAQAIDPQRVAIARGKVCDANGQPLAAVFVSILNHPEYGSSSTQADGFFDLAVNGGSPLVVVYTRAGYLPAQRQIQTAWQEYALLPEVVLLPLDSQVTTINLNSAAPIQVAQGSPVSDADGARQARILFPAGTQAELVLPNGVTQTLTTLHVRATEYTVGPNGPQAMPGTLPPSSGYTYALEYSVDEALAANASEVRFNQPLIHYVENFLGFPTGMAVPTGYYDKQKAAWVPAENGRVVKILSITSGAADLDTDGDGVVDNGNVVTSTMNLTITLAERQTLATMYQPGQSLWRVPLSHFTPWDCNWPYGAPDDAAPPALPQPETPKPEDTNDLQCHSIVECQNQNLREFVDVTGTPFRLYYQSGRAAGRRTAYTLNIPLTGPVVPDSVKGVELEISVAGRRFTQHFAATPNRQTTFVWDGKNAQDQIVLGTQPARVRVGYDFTAVYRTPAENAIAFAAYGENITGVRARQQVVLWQEWKTQIGNWQTQVQELGGWSLSVHHAYEPQSKTLYMGNGDQRGAASLSQDIIKTVAGDGQPGLRGDGGPVLNARFWSPQGVAFGPDGSLYVADLGNSRIRRINANGIITTVAGGGSFTPSLGDGGPATQALIAGPQDVVVGSDGSFYLSTTASGGIHDRIRKVDPNGIITTLAGTGVAGFSGDGGPATQAQINHPRGLALGPDGSLYFADVYNSRIRRIGPDGLMTTIAGGGNCATASCGDGGLATQARLNQPQRVVLGPDGSLYISELDRVRRVGPDGLITTVAGGGNCASNPCGDGGPATQAKIGNVDGLAVTRDGTLYIATYNANSYFVRRVGGDGIITTFAGSGTCPATSNCYSGEGGPALRAQFNPTGIVFGPDDNLYVADQYDDAIRRIGSSLPGFTAGEIVVPSDDGGQVYIFGASGQHLRTLNGLTGAVLYQFGYNATAQLISITDANNNVTTIERDANGQPTAIVAPFGQRTILAVDDNGYLSTITNPAGEAVQLKHTAKGLLTNITWPRGNQNAFTYDSEGRLIHDGDAAGGSLSLARSTTVDGYAVNVTTALSRTTIYQVTRSITGTQTRSSTSPNGLTSESVMKPDGSQTSRAVEGTHTASMFGPDPRWGMLAPLAAKAQFTTPAGLSLTLMNTRTVALATPTDPFSLIALTDTVALNAHIYTGTYNGAARTWTFTSPGGRQAVTVLDTQGRLVREQTVGLAPVQYEYDQYGRLITMTQGTGSEARSMTFAYNADGYLATQIDSMSHRTNLSYDAAGRVLTQTLADGQQILYSYDVNGQRIGIRPPDQPAHTFTYTPIDLVASYTAPASTGSVSFTYDADRQLIALSRPGGAGVQSTYDSTGQLGTVTTLRGPAVFSYSATTGQLTTIAAPQGINLTYTYDGTLLKDETWTGSITGTVGRTYDANLRLSTLSVAGSPIAYQYDPDGLLGRAGNWQLTRSPQTGLLISSTLGGVTDTQRYNAFAELAVYEAAYNGAAQYHTEYARDPLGRITILTETIEGATKVFSYYYDLVGRLTEVRQNGTPIAAYTYDANGNRLTFTGPGGILTGSYDNQDRLNQYGSTVYSYTLAGELLAQKTGGQTTTYQYDAIGNLMSVGLPNGNTITYLIDGVNRRVGKQLNGQLVQGWLYQDSLRIVAELDSAGNVTSRFVYGPGSGAPAYMIKGGDTYRIIADHLGSPRLVIHTATGQIVQRLDYDAFGNVTLDTNPGFQPFGFAGGLYDRDTQLIRFGARDYDPAAGRWTLKDPILFEGGQTNLYAYVYDDPVNWSDPRGLGVKVCWAGIYGGGGPSPRSISHWWLETSTVKRGMGSSPGSTLLVEWVDQNYKYELFKNPGEIQCEDQPNTDEECVEKNTVGSLGLYRPGNTCQDAVKDVLDKCTLKRNSLQDFLDLITKGPRPFTGG